MAKCVYKISKKIHKLTGLTFLAWFIVMAVSGVLLNHPELIRGISVPVAFVPNNFYYAKWNSMAMRQVVYSNSDPETMFACGRIGVWQSIDGGQTFSSMNEGYPKSAFDRDTNCLLLTENNGDEQLYAGNPAGLFLWDSNKKRWQKTYHNNSQFMEVATIVQVHDRLLVFTDSECFQLIGKDQSTALSPMPFELDTPSQKRISMTRFMLSIHDGSIMGISGNLFVDVLGLILLFLSLSAMAIWYIPQRRKKNHKYKVDIPLYRFLHRYHLKLGIFSLLFLLTITLTGMIIRAPFRQFIAGQTIPSTWYTGSHFSDRHHPKIRRVVYLEHEDTLLIATTSGFFTGPTDFSQPFVRIHLDVPVSGMGANVLEILSGNRLLIGSFSGLYIRDLSSGTVLNAIAPHPLTAFGPPGNVKNRAVGAAIRNGQLLFWVDYRRGVIPAHGMGDGVPDMSPPDESVNRMSLWRYLRILHTGHIFRGWLGQYTWLIIPIESILLLISLLTGGYDWLHRKGIGR